MTEILSYDDVWIRAMDAQKEVNTTDDDIKRLREVGTRLDALGEPRIGQEPAEWDAWAAEFDEVRDDWREATTPDTILGLLSRLEAAERERDELIDALDDMVNQHCWTSEGDLDSRALSANARAMRLLAAAGLICVTADVGRRVIATRVDDDTALAAKEQSK